jgi:hypothetical protein
MIGPYRPKKKVIYLDQNFVSNMAKAPSKPGLGPYERLFETLLRLVEGNVIACPTSEFHEREALYCKDEVLRSDIQRVTFRLSRGLGFCEWSEILNIQTIRAAYRYTRNDWPGTDLGWEEAFQRDPDTPINCSHIGKDASYVEVSPFFEAGLLAKHTYPGRARRMKAQTSARGVKFKRRLKEHFGVFARVTYIEPLRGLWQTLARFVAGERYNPFDLLPSFPSMVYEDFCRLLGRDDPEGFVRFLLSQEFEEIPFVRIFCLLHATMETEAAEPKASDYDDTMIAATVLPYCDVFATDGHMKQLIRALKLDRQYNVTVFGSRKADVLALTSLVREL